MIKASFWVFAVIILASCSKLPGEMNGPCTMEFRMFGVNITGASQSPMALDTFYTQVIHSNKSFHIPKNNFFDFYPVVSDGQLNLLPKNKAVALRFIGIKKNIKIVDEIFTVKNNGCHVEKISGRENVVVAE